MIDVQVKDTIKNEVANWKIVHTVLEPLPEWGFTPIGIDPGTAKLGISIIHPDEIDVFEIHMKRADTALIRMLNIQETLGMFIDDFITPVHLVVEGAAFAKGFRQVEMAEARASIILWANDMGFEVDMVSPGTIRKAVFGNGRCKASEFWKEELPPNGADALACALYGLL
jgi:Holliday junction resolvasome RuvABC endonuclease subunit